MGIDGLPDPRSGHHKREQRVSSAGRQVIGWFWCVFGAHDSCGRSSALLVGQSWREGSAEHQTVPGGVDKELRSHGLQVTRASIAWSKLPWFPGYAGLVRDCDSALCHEPHKHAAAGRPIIIKRHRHYHLHTIHFVGISTQSQ